MTDAIDHGCSGAITATDHGCDGTVTSLACVQEESISLSGSLIIAALFRKSTTQGTDITLSGGTEFTGSVAVSEGEIIPSIAGTVTITGAMTIQFDDPSDGSGTKVVIPVRTPR